MNDAQYLKALGARIRGEMNDLKRTPDACADELGWKREEVSSILSGSSTTEAAYALIEKMGEHYPIDPGDLRLIKDDCTSGVRIMRADESLRSSRIFDRANASGRLAPYYEYRDTAMARMAPFRPEWIRQLRSVSDSDPDNPDVVYNNGHALHQMTYFVGPVNFYYQQGGKSYCAEMNTGDSNYIMPFYPHSFARRGKEGEAYILAVTFGGDVRRAAKELYGLGSRGLNYRLEARTSSHRARVQLLKQHLANERMSSDHFSRLLQAKGLPVNLLELLDENREIHSPELEALADIFHVEVGDLLFAPCPEGHDVVIRHRDEAEAYDFPGEGKADYRIHPLARTRKMPLSKGFEITVQNDKADPKNGFSMSLHSYVYNYGSTPAKVTWLWEGKPIQERLEPGDSMYLSPFLAHSFSREESSPAHLVAISISGAVNLTTQREFSLFSEGDRVLLESKVWFEEGKE